MRRASSLTLPSLRSWQEAAFVFFEPVCASQYRLLWIVGPISFACRLNDAKLVCINNFGCVAVHVTWLLYNNQPTVSAARAPARGHWQRGRELPLMFKGIWTGLHAIIFGRNSLCDIVTRHNKIVPFLLNVDIIIYAAVNIDCYVSGN